MRKRKIGIIAAGAVVVCITISIFLQYNVEGNLYNLEPINDIVETKVDSATVAATYDVTRDKIFELLFRNKDFNNKFIKNQNPQENPQEEAQEEKPINDIVSILDENDKQVVYNIITGKDDKNNRKYLPETQGSINKSVVSTRRVQLPVSYLSQYPELPTGCEVTSLTTVLNYLKYNVTKEDMAANYLPKCNLSEGSFWDYFIGDPSADDAFGCYSSPIVTAANTYLKQQGSPYCAYNYSGSEFETFLKELEAGNPVILWSTMYLEKAFITFEWTINNQDVKWIAPEHCLVLIGYDLDANTVTLSDPMQGIVTVNMDLVNLRYMQMCSQAVVIKSNTKVDENVKNPIEATTQTTPEATTQPTTQQPTTQQPTTQATIQPTSQAETQAATQPITQATTQAITKGIIQDTSENTKKDTKEETNDTTGLKMQQEQ